MQSLILSSPGSRDFIVEKGMESHVIILILDRLDRPIDGPNAYIGMSRARGALTVLAHAGRQPEIESRLAP